MISTYFENGKFAGNFSSIEVVPEGYFIATKIYPNNLIDGYWSDDLQDWYENDPVLVLQIKVKNATSLVNEMYTKLHISSLQRVTGKLGSLDYLNIQREEYVEKYRIACLVLNDLTIDNQYMLSQLNEEMDFEDFSGTKLNEALTDLGLVSLNNRLKDFCQIVKFKYEYANDIFCQFKAMNTYFRTRMITDIELLDWQKFEQRMQMVKSITNDTSFSEIQTLFNQFKAL